MSCLLSEVTVPQAGGSGEITTKSCTWFWGLGSAAQLPLPQSCARVVFFAFVMRHRSWFTPLLLALDFLALSLQCLRPKIGKCMAFNGFGLKTRIREVGELDCAVQDTRAAFLR